MRSESFKRLGMAAENAAVLWAAAMLALVLAWSAVAWLIRVTLGPDFGWSSPAAIWVVAIGAVLCALYATVSTAKWMRRARDTPQPSGCWFKSSLFEAETGEDEETNPRLYGRQPAKWLRNKFLGLGYEVEEVFAEDWGWCVMCQREPYRLWIGCVSLVDYEHAKPDDPPPPPERLLWNVVPMAEIPFFRYLFKKKPDSGPGLEKIESELRTILESEPGIEIVDDEIANAWFGVTRKADGVESR